jgi:protein FrlC
MNQHYQRFSIDYFLDCALKVGFTNIELWCGASHFWLDAERHGDCAALAAKLASRGLKVVSLVSPSCSYQYQYAAPDAYAERNAGYFRNGIRAASELGAAIVAVNSGWGFIGEREDEMWKRSADNLHGLAEFASRYGVTLALESLRKDESNIVNNLASAKKMLTLVNHSNLKMMVDNIATGSAGESLDEWFDAFGDNLVHMHFLDGDPYVHNVWGDGNTSLSAQIKVLEERKYSGYLVQEIADERYFSDPFTADLRNMRMLGQFFE